LTARAPKHADRSVTVQLAAGETRVVEIQLTQEKSAEPASASGGGMAGWEQASAWTQEGTWYVRKGGNLVLYKASPSAGTYTFNGKLRKGKRLQWMVNVRDDKNYLLFQVDKKYFYRNQVIDGKSTQIVKVGHGMDKADAYTIEVRVKSGNVVNKMFNGETWGTLDSWSEAGTDFSKGKFGMLIPANDQVALENFKFVPEQ
jgi:hypothetical protein